MPRILILYHYFHPDPVVSAALYADLAADLNRRGWHVTAMPSNRLYADPHASLSAREAWQGVDIRRIWRPPLSQQAALGRILNAFWLLAAWSLAALRRWSLPDVDVVLIGTDPIFSVLVALPWKWFRPRTRRVHWCFDLYPEAAEADGLLRPDGLLARLLRRLLQPAYRACDLVADIGPCMRRRFEKYAFNAKRVTLTPWALTDVEPDRPEPEDPGSSDAGNGLQLLYSGSLGRAHDATPILALARRLRDVPIRFVFCILGPADRRLARSLEEDDRNIQLWEPVHPEQLADHLRQGDIHAVSLRSEWTGTVVPSKFFASLAAGRPVLFCGNRQSAPAQWIQRYQVGHVFDANAPESAEHWLRGLLAQPSELRSLQQRCFQVYQKHFSRRIVEDRWERHLQKLTSPTARPRPLRPSGR